MTKPSKPNVVLIFTDNQQAGTLGCYGNQDIISPKLDALAVAARTCNLPDTTGGNVGFRVVK